MDDLELARAVVNRQTYSATVENLERLARAALALHDAMVMAQALVLSHEGRIEKLEKAIDAMVHYLGIGEGR